MKKPNEYSCDDCKHMEVVGEQAPYTLRCAKGQWVTRACRDPDGDGTTFTSGMTVCGFECFEGTDSED